MNCTETFTKLLVSKHSPQNKCYADDGDVLFLRPKGSVAQRPHLSHYFISTKDRKTRSRYGWVAEVEPLTLDDFVSRYLSGWQPSGDEMAALQAMLRSISRLAKDTPVAATYSSRGVEHKTMELDVHRVLFYKTGL